MSAWLLDFLSNLAAGVVGGVVLAAGGALVSRRMTRRTAVASPSASATASAQTDVRIVVSLEGIDRRERVAAPGDGRTVQRTRPPADDDQQLIMFIVGAGLGVLLLSYGYLRFQDVILLSATTAFAMAASAIFGFLFLAGQRGVGAAGILLVHGVTALAASIVFLIDLYLLFRTSQEPDRQQLAVDARRGLAEFAARHSLLELLPVVYQLTGFALSCVVMAFCLWAAFGLLARIWEALALSAGRSPTRATRWLARTGPRGLPYVILVVFLSILSLLFTSGWLYGYVDRLAPSTSPAAQVTQLSTSTKKVDGGIRFCARLASSGQPLVGKDLQVENQKSGSWTPVGKPQTTDENGAACSRVRSSKPTKPTRWSFAGDGSYASSVSEVRSI